MKTISVIIRILPCISVVVVFAAVFGQVNKSVIRRSAFKNPERPPVLFRHDKHNDRAGIDECQVCHHVWRNGRLIKDDSSEDQHCADCHGSPSGDATTSLMKAYHLRCKGCHITRKTGPVMCGECHSKQNWKQVNPDSLPGSQ